MAIETLQQALDLFGLTWPVTRAALDARRESLLRTWHPHRYANLTNNPRKYMLMYKKGEAMTKDIHAAYGRLLQHLEQENTAEAGRGET
jgi:hypothetical protein